MFAKAINAIQQNFGYNRLRAFGGRVLPRLPFSVFCRFPFVQKADLTKEPFVKIEKSLFETACLPSRLPLVFCLVLRVVCKKRFTSKKGLRKCVTGALQLFFFDAFKSTVVKIDLFVDKAKFRSVAPTNVFFNLRFKKNALATCCFVVAKRFCSVHWFAATKFLL